MMRVRMQVRADKRLAVSHHVGMVSRWPRVGSVGTHVCVMITDMAVPVKVMWDILALAEVSEAE
ncbi:hypothetical protein E2C01_063588 [Portunus trituberculatus]|uniref:Uncharacterized protein n=1 Tax=Portunus trituberculatus TaxID=210409 RepID=A0A5B7HLA6_PORTR|nr:hypothetical protein [Portunus trituberculatus]